MKTRESTIAVIASLCLLGLIVLAAGCGSGGGSKTTTTTTPAPTSSSGVSFSKDIQPIFTANCVVCHTGASAPQGLSLDPGSAYKNLVNVKSTEAASLMRVAPGSPDNSYIIAKLTGKQAQVGGSGAQMPFGGAPLPQSTIDKIQQWITAGAQNN